MCAEEKEDAGGTREERARKRGKRREETRWRTWMEGEGTNAVGGSWRRNDYRPRTHSLPAIISSTNATKSIRRVSESGKYLLDSILIPSTHLHKHNDYVRHLNLNVVCPIRVSCVDTKISDHTY